MSNKEIKETLEKQLQLLSERSQKTNSPSDLVNISEVMCRVAAQLTQFPQACK